MQHRTFYALGTGLLVATVAFGAGEPPLFADAGQAAYEECVDASTSIEAKGRCAATFFEEAEQGGSLHLVLRRQDDGRVGS